MLSRPLCSLVFGSLALFTSAARAETVIPLGGDVPDDGTELLLVPFDVPAGTKEIQIDHDDLSAANILDRGLADESGKFRGWGGGNPEPAIVGDLAASRSYLAGPLAPGSWKGERRRGAFARRDRGLRPHARARFRGAERSQHHEPARLHRRRAVAARRSAVRAWRGAHDLSWARQPRAGRGRRSTSSTMGYGRMMSRRTQILSRPRSRPTRRRTRWIGGVRRST